MIGKLWFISVWVFVIVSFLIVLGILFGCDRPLTQEEQWVQEQDRKCIAAKSRGAYNKQTNTYECWNKPAFRRPKLVFTEKYV